MAEARSQKKGPGYKVRTRSRIGKGRATLKTNPSEAIAPTGTPGSRGLATVATVIEEFRDKYQDSAARGGVTAIKHFPAREAKLVPLPEFLPEKLAAIHR